MGKPKCARILAMTAGSSMVAISVTMPPQWAQTVMSMSKIRLSNYAQLRRVGLEAEQTSLEANGSLGAVGTI